tara:strand:+ start:144 stop:449 length:306 start_codon:yes stop_codon:yes gene_type:complete
MRKYSVVNEEGVIEEFVQLVGEADHAALDDAIELAHRAGEDVVEHLADGSRVVVWEFAGGEPWDDGDRFADGEALASAGFARTRIMGVSTPGTSGKKYYED